MNRALVEHRVRKGLSRRAAAMEMGVSRETLAKAERGESVAISPARKIAAFYEKDVLDLWTLEDFTERAA